MYCRHLVQLFLHLSCNSLARIIASVLLRQMFIWIFICIKMLWTCLIVFSVLKCFHDYQMQASTQDFAAGLQTRAMCPSRGMGVLINGNIVIVLLSFRVVWVQSIVWNQIPLPCYLCDLQIFCKSRLNSENSKTSPLRTGLLHWIALPWMSLSERVYVA